MFITIAYKQSTIPESAPEIKIDSTVIEISSKEKLLGVTTDNTFNFGPAIMLGTYFLNFR